MRLFAWPHLKTISVYIGLPSGASEDGPTGPLLGGEPKEKAGKRLRGSGFSGLLLYRDKEKWKLLP